MGREAPSQSEMTDRSCEGLFVFLLTQSSQTFSHTRLKSHLRRLIPSPSPSKHLRTPPTLDLFTRSSYLRPKPSSPPPISSPRLSSDLLPTVNVWTHTATVTPDLEHREFIKELKQLHKAHDDKELFGMAVTTQPKDETAVKLNELNEKRRDKPKFEKEIDCCLVTSTSDQAHECALKVESCEEAMSDTGIMVRRKRKASIQKGKGQNGNKGSENKGRTKVISSDSKKIAKMRKQKLLKKLITQMIFQVVVWMEMTWEMEVLCGTYFRGMILLNSRNISKNTSKSLGIYFVDQWSR
ncbi:unnamed protein product [Lactuca saligna]|uniref:Uncharacterized protein n=1 Tax=Lactuca saligna TaxID=75948 RepID=A0AA35VQV3_LACSI|nr:unnamed protein product [Lactuca saligna]